MVFTVCVFNNTNVLEGFVLNKYGTHTEYIKWSTPE